MVEEKGRGPSGGHGQHPRQEPRQRPHPRAVGRQPAGRLHHRRALDQGQPQLPSDQRSSGAWPTPTPVFHYYRRLIQLRKDNPVIVYGAYDLILDDHPQIYAFTRTLDDDRLLVVLNFSASTPVFDLPADIAVAGQELLISNYPVDPGEAIRRLSLRPYEARVYRLKQNLPAHTAPRCKGRRTA